MADLRVPSAPGARKPRRQAVKKTSRGLTAADSDILGLETNRILARDAVAKKPRKRRGVGGSNYTPGTGPEVPADQVFHDFTNNTLGPFKHARGTAATGTSELAGTNEVGSGNVPIYNGARLTPPSSWQNDQVGYGAQVEPESKNYLMDGNDFYADSWARDNTVVNSGVVSAIADGGTISQLVDVPQANYVFAITIDPEPNTDAVEISTDGLAWLKIDTTEGRTVGRVTAPSTQCEVSVRFYKAGEGATLRNAGFGPGGGSYITTAGTAPKTRGRVFLDSLGLGAGVVDNFAIQVCCTPLTDHEDYPERRGLIYSAQSSDGSCGLEVWHDSIDATIRAAWWTPTDPYAVYDGPAVPMLQHQLFDVRIIKTDTDGLTILANGLVLNAPALTKAATSPLAIMRLGSAQASVDTGAFNFQWVRVDPTGTPLSEVQTWPAWEHPQVVAVAQPESISLGAPSVVEPVAITRPVSEITTTQGSPITLGVGASGSEPLVYFWETNFSGSFQPLDMDFITTAPDSSAPGIQLPADYTGSFAYRVTVGNPAGSQVSSSTITAALPTVIPEGALVTLFTDIIDGVNHGWHDDDSKGAAVTIYGAGFGPQNADSRVFFGDTAVPNGHIVEWSAAQYPANVPGLYMITVHVGDNIPTGSQPITVEVGDGTGGDILRSTPLPFVVRDTGEIRYFDAAQATNGDGSWDNPYRYPGDVFTGTSSPTQVGWHYYFKDGTYIPSGNNKRSILYFYGSRGGPALPGEGIQFSAYPGHQNVIFNTRDIEANVDSNGVRGTEDCDWYVYSKFDIYAWHGSINVKGADGSGGIGCRCNGLHHHGSGRGDVGFGGWHKNNGIRLMGLEIRDGNTANKYDHAFYPGGGGTDWGENHFAYNWIYRNDYRQGGLCAYNYSENNDDEPSRITPGEYIKRHYFHHNLVDCRIPDEGNVSGLHMAIGLGLNGFGDNRPIKNMPTTAPFWSETFYAFNNIFIGDSREGIPTDGKVHPSVCPIFLSGGAGDVSVFNNTVINWNNSGAIALKLGKVEEEQRQDTVITLRIKGNMFITENPAQHYWQSAYDGPTAITAADNIYYGGLSDTTIPGDGAPTTELDPQLTYDITVDPPTFSLAPTSPAVGLASNYGIATHDFAHVPYGGASGYATGALQPTEALADD